MLIKKDILLVFFLIAVAGILLLISTFLRTGENAASSTLYVRYRVNEDIVKTIPLTEESELVIDTGDGMRNTLRLWPGGVAMTSSTCYNQLCVYQGEVTPENMDERPLYHMIVCAPHRLVVELLREEEVNGTDAWQ